MFIGDGGVRRGLTRLYALISTALGDKSRPWRVRSSTTKSSWLSVRNLADIVPELRSFQSCDLKASDPLSSKRISLARRSSPKRLLRGYALCLWGRCSAGGRRLAFSIQVQRSQGWVERNGGRFRSLDSTRRRRTSISRDTAAGIDEMRYAVRSGACC